MINLQNKVINQIEKEAIRPKPRYYFGIRNITVWLIAVLATITGILSVALISYNLSSQDWDIYSHLNESFVGFVVSSLPYLWIILTLLMLAIAAFNIEHSKKGYKYPPLLVAAISLVVTLAIGLAVQAFGGGAALDNYLGHKLAGYQSVESQREKVWNQPSLGLFSGTIQSIDNQTLAMEDVEGKTWQVNYPAAIIRGNLKLNTGTKIKIIGQAENNTITASEIRPWMGNGYGSGQRHGRQN